jgi:hypothetical protein
MIRWQLTARAEFEGLVAMDPDTLTELEPKEPMFQRRGIIKHAQRWALPPKPNGKDPNDTAPRAPRRDFVHRF